MADPVEYVVFRLDPPVGKLSRKMLSRKCKKARLGFSQKRQFSTDTSDCVRNGLILSKTRFWIQTFCGFLFRRDQMIEKVILFDRNTSGIYQDRKIVLRPVTAHPHKAHTPTPYNSLQRRRRLLGCNHCCCFSPRVIVAHPCLRPPAARAMVHPMAATRSVDDLSPTAAALSIASAALDYHKSNATTPLDRGLPARDTTRVSRGKDIKNFPTDCPPSSYSFT